MGAYSNACKDCPAGTFGLGGLNAVMIVAMSYSAAQEIKHTQAKGKQLRTLNMQLRVDKDEDKKK